MAAQIVLANCKLRIKTKAGTLENGALSAGAINTELVPAEKVEKYNAYLQQMMDGTFMK
mgnify:CR=1 FL=1